MVNTKLMGRIRWARRDLRRAATAAADWWADRSGYRHVPRRSRWPRRDATLSWRSPVLRSCRREANPVRRCLRICWRRALLWVALAECTSWLLLRWACWLEPLFVPPSGYESLASLFVVGMIVIWCGAAALQVGTSSAIPRCRHLTETGPAPKFERAFVRVVLHPEGWRRLHFRILLPAGHPWVNKQSLRPNVVNVRCWLPASLGHEELEAFLGHPIPVRDRRHRSGHVLGVRPPTGRFPLSRRRIP